MKRAIGFAGGQLGDIVISTVTARAFKAANPDWHLTLGVGPQFKQILPLFHDHPYFDATHVYSGYDDWPAPHDVEYLEAAKYDHVFHAMAPIRGDWYRYGHQAAEVTRLRGLETTDLRCELNQWFSVEALYDTIAFAPFAAWHDQGAAKQFTPARAQVIVNLLKDKGFKVLQLGGPTEPQLENAYFPKASYFDSVRAMLGCTLLIHSDTGLGWCASAYGHFQLGLYSQRHFGPEFISHIQPVNPNGLYLDAPGTVNDISLDRISTAVDRLLL